MKKMILLHMRIRTIRVVLLAILLLFGVYLPGLPPLFKLLPLPPRAAASVTLYGRVATPNGWGSSSTTVTNPGPDIAVSAGASVSLSLFSADSFSHQFCVDYEPMPDFSCQTPTEPQSPFFTSPTVPTSYTFTATSKPGNYTYYCSLHTTAMVGKFVVLGHDVAVTGLAVSRNFAYNGVVSNPVQVNVTAANLGTSTEAFFISALANSTLIGNQSITLGAGLTEIVSFLWSTSALTRGSYVMSAQATKVSGELDTSNNSLVGNNFSERFRGDVTGDCKVNILDLVAIASTFGSTIGQTSYNPNADLNNDGKINILDLVVVAGNFGQAC